eukprot:456235-Prymnesium_polylepis.1
MVGAGVPRRSCRRAATLEAAAERAVERVMLLPRAARRAGIVGARAVREALAPAVEARRHGPRAAHG